MPKALDLGVTDDSQHYLVDFLEDEFRGCEGIRIRPTRFSKDRGVTVKTETREYFFSARWVDEREFSRIQELASRIKELL